jgi:hypothetical protein
LPSFSFPSFEWPTISFAWLPSFEWPSISFPTLSLPSLPSFSFDFSAFTNFFGDKYEAVKVFSVDIFGNIYDGTVALLNEAQIVWNENFNAVSSPKVVEVVQETVTAAPVFEPELVPEIVSA